MESPVDQTSRGPNHDPGGSNREAVRQCRSHALAVGEPYGIWGGLSESERELLLKRGIRRTA
jgi:hypothetical protein